MSRTTPQHGIIIIQLVSSETTKAPTKEAPLKASSKMPVKDYVSTASMDTSRLNSFWVYRPELRQPQANAGTRRVMIRQPHFLTRLAKSLTPDFDPYFSKGYFEPFEKRPKPVTLVTFRKNGHMTRKNLNVNNDMVFESKSAEVAELQSPYNEIGSFWQDNLVT